MRYTPLTTAPPVGSSADAPAHSCGIPPLEPDAGAPADEGVEVVAAVAEDQVADQLRPAIEAVLDDLDRWLTPATK
jgi:hypothetical protein